MNNDDLKRTIKKICPFVKRYEFYKNTIIYKDENEKKHVIKSNENDILDIYNYLNSRGFGYLPRLEYCDDSTYVYEYVKDTITPKEQRISDLIKIDALLHNKTVYYKDISLDEIKETYESIGNNIDSTFNYYDDLITMIESKIYMSPAEYMLARNCSSIFSCLNFCRKELDNWYEMMQNTSKKRVVLLHNNLSPDHLIRKEDNVLIGWNKAYRGSPIHDFIKLYKENYDKYDFNELYHEYIKRFPLTPDERKLMFIILFLPSKIEFKEEELKSTINIAKLCNYLVTTDKLFMENEAKYSKEKDDKVYE